MNNKNTSLSPSSSKPKPGRTRRHVLCAAIFIFLALVSMALGFGHARGLEDTRTVTFKRKAVLKDTSSDISKKNKITEENAFLSQGRFQELAARNKLKTLSWVTSFWAEQPTEEGTPKNKLHRAEIMASIANNLNNPHFDQVVIILDSATELSNCDHFRSKMKHFQRRFRRWSDDNQIHDVLLPKNKNKPILTCIDRPEGQPSYFDMFRYASNPDIVTSEVVIMGNADQAFDDSVSWASLIKNRTLLTLPTQGYQQDRAPPRVQAFFQFASTQGVSKRKSKTESGTVNIPNRCAKATTLSWDSYVFPRALLEEKISETAFQRGVLTGPNGEPNGMAYFPMNMQGAEDAALWAVTKKLRNIQVAYGCDIIKTWHFHAARKMHLSGGKQIHWDWQHPITISGKAHTRVEFNNTLLVPTPWRKPRDELDDAFVIQPAEFMQQ